MEQQGITSDSMNPDDRDREIYECYCELNINGFEHKAKGKSAAKPRAAAKSAAPKKKAPVRDRRKSA